MAELQKRATLLPYGQQWIDDDDIAAIVDVLKGNYITQGPSIEQFEVAIAEYVGASYAVAFSNGTAALHGACFAAGIGVGDEVITTPITFAASSNCVLYCGGTPVFADIQRDTYNIDPASVNKQITSKTKAIIPVDLTGQPADLDSIMDIARRHNLVVIEDAAHSLGASYRNQKVGAIADMTMFSFHPVKHITTGEGGVIVTNNSEYYQKLLLFRSHGITRDPHQISNNEGPWYYEMQELGYNYRMTDIQAVLGLSQLSKLDSFVARRREIAQQYTEVFQQYTGLVIPYQSLESNSSWHLYVLRFEPEYFTVDRRTIFEQLRQMNIGVNVHYIPVYQQPYYRQNGYHNELHEQAEHYYNTCISIPLFPKMTDQDVKDVIEAIQEVYNMYKKM
ncbi:UDP-4-amino-4,6-dideoxy-N-acetyl-beta-L-altrosamine transaminase [Paenibacillus sp. GXUN7292]|uniref:UDP-4-amino-4, 6-dideoxy-N-acetyl-beta-L-altrosamine transaminase n=1 Tax=Paenibacillus sp. GXUN7292 TaxID=3422499 RepID=UPI003D7DA6A7